LVGRRGKKRNQEREIKGREELKGWESLFGLVVMQSAIDYIAKHQFENGAADEVPEGETPF
jgi:hypothetical protein